MDKKQAQQLLNNYLNGTCTDKEKLELEQWYNQEIKNNEAMPPVENCEKVEKEILARLPVGKPEARKRYHYPIAFASMVALALCIGLFFIRQEKERPQAEARPLHDALAGGNKAVLTLADGRTVDLSSTQEGIMIETGTITYTDGSELEAYGAKEKGNSQQGNYNTISTPRGGQYQIILPDGTKVWLNAASTLRYPVGYDDGNRTVELEGEAYFEVTKRKSGSKSAPFSVNTAGQRITVLGTEFNLSAYAEEDKSKTTLVSGEVKVSAFEEGKELHLLPGQEAVLSPKGIDVNEVDVRSAISWKNGDFVFADEGIQSIMRQLSRWYDVEVEYKGAIPPEGFGGKISRDKNLSQVLKVLEATGGVRFQIEERKIIVSP